jgi:hypothetical protein
MTAFWNKTWCDSTKILSKPFFDGRTTMVFLLMHPSLVATAEGCNAHDQNSNSHCNERRESQPGLILMLDFTACYC